MVKITDGKTTVTVTGGAFRSTYEGQGWTVVEDKAKSAKPTAEGELTAEEKKAEKDKKFVDAFVQTPVSQWKKDDMKKIVTLFSIDTTAVANFEEAKAIVKAELEKQGVLK